MIRKRYIFIAYLFAICAMAMGIVQCTGKDEDTGDKSAAVQQHKWLNLADSARYVGMQTCRQCHEDKHASFIHTGMGQSFGRATREKSAGDFHRNKPVYDKHLDLYYQPFWQDSALMLKEYRLKGKDTVHSRVEKIDYIIGSGHHTNSHILSRNGYLTQAPFTFYVQEGMWNLPPGYEDGYNSRFSRDLGVECLTCHNGYPDPVEGSFNKYAMVPLGIDCERCHGPGSIHVNAKYRGEIVNTRNDTDFTIVNPRKLPYEYQIDVCQRCHLQGNAVLKEGKTFFDFKPGMRLKDIMDVYLPVYENQEEGFLMASHAERMQKSPCFLESHKKATGEQMTCLTCHNPHVSVKETTHEDFIAKCKSCHQQPHASEPQLLVQENGNCLPCHMPKSSAVDIPHITITDHYIRVPKDVPMNVIGVGKFQGLTAVNNESPSVLSKAKAYMYFYEKFDHKAYYLDSAKRYLSQLPEKDHLAEHIYYYYLKEDFRQLVKTSRLAGNNTFSAAITNYQVAQAFMNLGQQQAAVPYMQAAVKQQPYHLDYRIKLGTLYIQLQQFDKAQSEFNFVLKENPAETAAWNNLAFLNLVLNNTQQAREQIKKAIALDPDYIPAKINMVKLLLAEQRTAEAKKLVNDIIRKYPDNRDALTLKQYLERQGL